MPTEATAPPTPEDTFRAALRAIVRHDKTPPYAVGEPSAVGDPAPEGGRWLTPAEHAGMALQQTVGLAILDKTEREIIEWALRAAPMPSPEVEWRTEKGAPLDRPAWADDEDAFNALAERIGALK